MKQTKNSTSQECISLKDLHDYYTTKFSVKNSHNENEFLKSARTTIETKYELIKDKVCEELKPFWSYPQILLLWSTGPPLLKNQKQTQD